MNAPADLRADLEAVIFDMDGVLINSEPVHEDALARVFERYDIDLPDSVYAEFKGRTDHEILQHVAEAHTDGRVSIDELVQAKREAFWELLDEDVPMPGAEAFVRAAAERYRVGLCTSASQTTRELAFDPLGWEEHFAAFVTAEDVEHSKPHPEPYQLAAERLDVAPERCLVVEDSLSGVRSGRAAGCYVAALTTSMPEADLREAGAQFVADTFGELADQLGWEGVAAGA